MILVNFFTIDKSIDAFGSFITAFASIKSFANTSLVLLPFPSGFLNSESTQGKKTRTYRDVALHFSLVVSRVVILPVSFQLPHRTYLPLVFPESTKHQTTELPAQFFSLIEEYVFPPVFDQSRDTRNAENCHKPSQLLK
jgi:hypothetical protein